MSDTVSGLPCGGCGNDDPNARCLGCMHEFRPSPSVSDAEVEAALEEALRFITNIDNASNAARLVRAALASVRSGEAPVAVPVEVPDIKLVIADYLQLRDEAMGFTSDDDERSTSAIELHDAIQAIHAKLSASPTHPGEALKPADDGWQDISTAPKDGRLMLLSCATWAHSRLLGKPVPVKIGGFNDTHWEIFGASWIPTHWRPLPVPPLVMEA